MKYFALIIFLSFTLFLTSCGEDNEEVPVTLPTTGKISGSVNLYNEGTDKISGSDMRISVSGTNISTLTNDQGSFQLADVPFGARTLSYEKTGYGTYKYFISDLSGNLSISATPSLGKLSPTKVITCAVTNEGDDIKISSVTDGTNTSKRYLRYFFGTDETVSKENYTQVSLIFESDINVNPANHLITQQDLIDLGFNSGSQVYVKVYGESFWSNEYEDTSLNRQIFPNLNEISAEPVMFMVP